jgi:hypothetical protein
MNFEHKSRDKFVASKEMSFDILQPAMHAVSSAKLSHSRKINSESRHRQTRRLDQQ